MLYDRDGSAVSVADVSEYDFSSALNDVHWLHVTGITPAISENAFRVNLEMVRRAKSAGAVVSCDLNFRKKLWRWRAGTSAQHLARLPRGQARAAERRWNRGRRPRDEQVRTGAIERRRDRDAADGLEYAVGAEYWLLNLVALRAGSPIQVEDLSNNGPVLAAAFVLSTPIVGPTNAGLTENGRRATLVTFTALGKYKVVGTINDKNLVELTTTWIPTAVYGDTLYEIRHLDYKDFGGVQFPTQIHMHQGDPVLNPAHNMMDIRVSNVQTNVTVPAMSPATHRKRAPYR